MRSERNDVDVYLRGEYHTTFDVLDKLREGGIPDALLEPILNFRGRFIFEEKALRVRDGIPTSKYVQRDTLTANNLVHLYTTLSGVHRDDYEAIENDLERIGALVPDVADALNHSDGDFVSPRGRYLAIGLYAVLDLYKMHGGNMDIVEDQAEGIGSRYTLEEFEDPDAF